MPIDPAVLDELERLEKAATPGPLYLEAYNESGPVKVTNGVRWQRAREDGGGVKLKVEVCRISEQYMERSKRIANGELIVAMWNALPDLIAALRESQANDFPKPVPGEVLDDIKWLRSVMVAHEECTGPMIYATPTSIARFKRICDYIESLDPPKPELPLPEWKRGTWNGVPCVACKMFHPGFQESRWLILMGDMLIERNLAEVAHGNLQFDGAAP